MLKALKLLILLVIFLSQYTYAESHLKGAQDGQPKSPISVCNEFT